jgi:hypothetical protein
MKNSRKTPSDVLMAHIAQAPMRFCHENHSVIA